MPKFMITEKFKFGESIYNAGEILTISDADLEKEIAKGKDPIKGKWLSGVLSHGRKLDPAVKEDGVTPVRWTVNGLGFQ